MEKKEWIARIEIEKDFKALIVKAAKSQGLNITSYIKMLIREDLIKNNHVKPSETKSWKK